MRDRIATRLFLFLVEHVIAVRPPDFIVGQDSPDGAYLLRWYLTPWRRWQTRLRERAAARPTRTRRLIAWLGGLLPNLYLHKFLRDDDDRALHDHPSWAVSYMLMGSYIEHTIAAGGIHHRVEHRAGAVRYLPVGGPKEQGHAHRIELLRDHLIALPRPAYTLFLFGPNVREWGFHCPERGWVPWQQFTAAGKPGEVGKGCDA